MLTTKQKQFVSCLARITSRDIYILDNRYNLKYTLEEIGKRLNLTVERVRQLEKRALDRIQSYD